MVFPTQSLANFMNHTEYNNNARAFTTYLHSKYIRKARAIVVLICVKGNARRLSPNLYKLCLRLFRTYKILLIMLVTKYKEICLKFGNLPKFGSHFVRENRMFFFLNACRLKCIKSAIYY